LERLSAPRSPADHRHSARATCIHHHSLGDVPQSGRTLYMQQPAIEVVAWLPTASEPRTRPTSVTRESHDVETVQGVWGNESHWRKGGRIRGCVCWRICWHHCWCHCWCLCGHLCKNLCRYLCWGSRRRICRRIRWRVCGCICRRFRHRCYCHRRVCDRSLCHWWLCDRGICRHWRRRFGRLRAGRWSRRSVLEATPRPAEAGGLTYTPTECSR
jgi:hypothetical protein